MNTKHVLYAGSFDPFHNGHLNIIEKTCRMIPDCLITILVCENIEKTHMFSCNYREAIIKKIIANSEFKSQILVDKFSENVGDYCSEKKIDTLIRGIRSSDDMLYEGKIIDFYRMNYPNINVVLITSDIQNISVSSTDIRKKILDTIEPILLGKD